MVLGGVTEVRLESLTAVSRLQQHESYRQLNTEINDADLTQTLGNGVQGYLKFVNRSSLASRGRLEICCCFMYLKYMDCMPGR